MYAYRAFALDPNSCLTKSQSTKLPNLTLYPAASAEELRLSLVRETPDLIFLDLELPEGLSGLDLVNDLRQQNPNIPVILLTESKPSEEVWGLAANKPFLELVQTPTSIGELQFRLARLLPERLKGKQPKPGAIKVRAIDALRNDKSGRLDVNRIADLFNLTVTDISRSMGRSQQGLSKTPDAASLQGSLHDFERIASALLTVTGSIKGLKMWLNKPNPEFDEDCPIDFIKRGQVAFLADLVEDALLGQPG